MNDLNITSTVKEHPTAERNSAIERIEPPSWWVGMKTPLRLMLYGNHIGEGELVADSELIQVKKTYKADSPNYLFADIEISAAATPGDYKFRLSANSLTEEFLYRIDQRREGSALRSSYDSSDVVYLLMPDRFARGSDGEYPLDGLSQGLDRSDPFGRHGGDIKGITDHLDYFEKIGVTTLWITPVQLDDEEYGSYHGYACGDFYKVDPRFGDNESYKKLVSKAHKRGLKVIMDVVLNHCGSRHWWMKDLPFRNWIHLRQKDIRSSYRLVALTDPNVAPSDLEITVNGWFDKDMPDIGLENEFALHYFIQVYVWWTEWADLDGLRVDTFPYNDKYAAAKWTRAILEEYPNLNIVAECWHSSPAVVSYWDGRKTNSDGYCSNLPTIMDFPLQEAIDAGLKDPREDWDAGPNKIYEALAHDFLYTEPRSLLIFLDNHDTGRFADTVDGSAEKIKAGLTLLATLRGIPQLYYGTEFGQRSTDLKSGDGSGRADFPGGWPEDERNFFAPQGMDTREKDIFDHAVKLFRWRKNSTAIHKGKMVHYLPDGATYSFFRYTEQETVMVFLNVSEKTVEIDWPRYESRTLGYRTAKDIISGKKFEIGKQAKVYPRTSLVLELQK